MAEHADLTWEEAHHAIVPLLRADNRTNLKYIALEYGALIVALGGSAWAYSRWTSGLLPSSGFVPLAVLGILVIAAVQHRLSGLAHDASHYTLFRNKLVNELASDFLLMFPLMAMTQKFRNTHNGHHRFVNDPERDPDLRRLQGDEDHPFPMPKARFWFRYVVKGLWLPSIWKYLYGQARNANASDASSTPELRAPYRFRVGRMMRGCYWLSVLAVVNALHAWPIFFLFWVVPLLTAYPLFMQLREIAHHSNAPDDGDLTNSRVFFVNPILDAAVFPYGQAFHVTHHMFAMLPHYRMAEAHATLLRYRPYRENVVICRGFFFRSLGTKGPSVLDILSERREAAIA
jgi:fatty acid desaturase